MARAQSSQGEGWALAQVLFGDYNPGGRLVALRIGDWKIVYVEQQAKQMACRGEPFVHLRMPKLFHLRRDPFERADENSNTYWDWYLKHLFFAL